MSFGEVWSWAKTHPALAGLSVVGVGVFVLWMLGYFSRGSQQQSSGSSDLAAYYAANIAQQKYNAEVTVAQTQAGVQTHAIDVNATTQQAAIAANENIYNTQTSAALQLGTTQSNNAVTQTMYAAQTAQAASAEALQAVSLQTTGQTIPSVVTTTDAAGNKYLLNSAGQITSISPPGFAVA